jgi:nucleoside diphosphate kinase
MRRDLSYIIVTPYTIAKSRTGGVISRLLSQTDLELVAAQMITPDINFIKDYAASIRTQGVKNRNTAAELLATYIEKNMAPSGGRAHRFLLLIFEGENPCRKLSDIGGALFPKGPDEETAQGETIRDTYADYIVDHNDSGKVVYFEPAILTPRAQDLANENMAIFAHHFRNHENIVKNMSYPDSSKIEQTLVILKPDNWIRASSRPGTIIDMFSRTGLRIVGIKIFRFSLNQALDFYQSVEANLMEKIAPVFAQKAKECLEKAFEFSLSQKIEKTLCDSVGIEYAREQFQKILEFMSSRRSDTCLPENADKPGDVKCLILVYEGEKAIEKIREVLGPTDPLKARGGTVRREFGSNVMVNTAHASDSKESYEKEKAIVRITENNLISIIDSYLANSNLPG